MTEKTNEKTNMLDLVQGRLIVSCQALPSEPLHSPFIMGRMALAAFRGGAAGIRANGVEDIKEIKKNVNLPIIGIVKQDYEGYDVFITPTEIEVEALIKEGVDMIAMDATNRTRPGGGTISDLFPKLRKAYPDQLFMADISTLEEALTAVDLGFDCVGTTLSGYTAYTADRTLPDFELVQQLVERVQVPIIAEGGIWTPEQLRRMFELGVHAAVVGTAITRPMEITQKFVQSLPSRNH